jgi:hypothetical protein
MAGYFEERDPLFFSPQLGVMFPNTGLKLEGLLTQGKISAVMSRAARSKLSADKKYVADKYVLSKGTAKTYAGIFQRHADRGGIPWILGPASLIPGIGSVITIATSTVDGLQRLAGSDSVSASQMVVLVADGGAFMKTWSIEKHPQHGELLVTMVFYSVVVGNENRLHGVYSSKHALLVRD